MIVGDGRPLRFLALVGGGWLGMRVLSLWYVTGSLPEAVRGVIPAAAGTVIAATPAASPGVLAPEARASAQAFRVASAASGVSMSAGLGAPSLSTPAAGPRATPVDPVRVQLALLALTRIAGTAIDQPSNGSAAASPGSEIVMMPFRPGSTSRVSVSAWMIARGGGGAGTGSLAPQLGGTQGGVRVDYALGRGIAATGRLAAPAAGAGREASVGVAWRPARVPLRFVAEQRFALDGGRSGPALGVSGGVSALRLPAGFRIDGYGQAGAIARAGIERYVDASVRTARPVAELAGVTIDAGGGAWGGAQRGVARLDIGPSIGAIVPLARSRLRLSLDWRQRIAGNARPNSGLALTLGTDF